MNRLLGFVLVSTLFLMPVRWSPAQPPSDQKDAKLSTPKDVPPIKVDVKDDELQKLLKLTVKPDITYSNVNGKVLMLDIVLPPGKGPFSTVLIFPGSGPFSKGRENLRDTAETLARNGFIAAAVDYRCGANDQFPAAFDDAFAALNWLQTNAGNHGIDKNRIAVVGFSAGGTLAMILGTQKSGDVRAVVSYFGPTDIELLHKNGNIFVRTMLEKWLGGTPNQVPKKYRDASPKTHVQNNSAPHLFIQGKADGIVPIEQPDVMVTTLSKAGVKTRMVTLYGAPHNFDEIPGFDAHVASNAMILFLREQMTTPIAKVNLVNDR